MHHIYTIGKQVPHISQHPLMPQLMKHMFMPITLYTMTVIPKFIVKLFLSILCAKDRKNDEVNEMYTDIPSHDSVHHDCNGSKSNEKDIPFSSVHHDRNESNVEKMCADVSDFVNHDNNEGEDMYRSIRLQEQYVHI